MIFGKLADFIARHYKGIIVAWLIVLAVSVPVAPMAFNIVSYEETEMAPSDIESEVAQRFIDEHFPSASGEGSTIIVLTGEDVLDNGTKEIVFRIDDAVFDETHGGRIDGQVQVDSLYSVTTLYTTGFLQQLNQGFYDTWNMTNLTAFALFGIPTEFRNLWYQANGSAFTIYGIPSLHVQIWSQIRAANSGATVSEVDSMAYAATLASLQFHPMIASMDASQKALIFGWFGAYSQVWNLTVSDPFFSNNPAERSVFSIQSAFPAFLAGVPPEGQPFLNATFNTFDMTNWYDYRTLNAFSLSVFESNLDPILAGLTDEERSLVLLYLDVFYGGWNSTSSVPSDTEFETIVASSVATLSSAIGGERAIALMSIFESLGWSGWDNETAILQLSVSLVAENSNSEPWIVYEVKGIPSGSSFMEFMTMAEAVVENSTIGDFPIPMFSDLVGMFVNSPQNDTMIISLTYTSPDGDSLLGQKSVEVIRDILKESLEGTNGLTSFVTGSDAISADLQASTWSDVDRIDPITIILVLVLIGVFFRSVVASSVPPAVIGVALGVSFAGVYVLGSFFLSVHYSVLTLLLTSMMGAGCDYCIFILTRYREERRRGLTKEESVRTAVTWAGESIATSGATVIIGFGVLSFGRFDMLQSMGIGLAMGIAIALIAALTLLPSVLMLLGDRIFWPSKIGKKKETGRKVKTNGYFSKSAKFAIKHAKIILVAALAISVPTTYLALTLDTSYDFIAAMPDTESKEGMDRMSEGFGAGRIMSTTVALNMTSPVFEGGTFNVTELDSIENLSESISELDNVEEVTSPTRPLGGEEPIHYANLSFYSEEQAAQYSSLMMGMLGTDDTRAVLITVVFKEEPFAKASIDSIGDLRSVCRTFEADDPNINRAMVAGSTASMSDISDMVQSDFGVMEIFVVIGIYIVLMIVLGSIVNPLRSILTILLSISWTIAITMVIFNFVLGFPILWLMPMILFVVCLGLGMDYDIFLTTRIREEAQKGMSDKDAIVHAVERTGGVITACGIIMAGAFGTMMLSEGALLREFGFALMFAILLDATIVRIYLVPAIMSLLGKWNWYAPGRLQRVRRDEKKMK
ncbi:MAG: MMPL family transporter [Methanomassiliicoccales archaeon]|nr:MMPL family transporter [Methanomassiliicoccales archaeon]